MWETACEILPRSERCVPGLFVDSSKIPSMDQRFIGRFYVFPPLAEMINLIECKINRQDRKKINTLSSKRNLHKILDIHEGGVNNNRRCRNPLNITRKPGRKRLSKSARMENSLQEMGFHVGNCLRNSRDSSAEREQQEMRSWQMYRARCIPGGRLRNAEERKGRERHGADWMTMEHESASHIHRNPRSDPSCDISRSSF